MRLRSTIADASRALNDVSNTARMRPSFDTTEYGRQ
jgi:hypothetical protein